MIRKYLDFIQAWLILAIFLPCAAPASESVHLASHVPDFSRLSLHDAEALWAARNRELKLARDAVEGAKADKISAGQRPNPQLSVNTSSINPRDGIGSGGLRDKQADTVFRLDQLIERGGKRELRTKTSEARLDASRRDLANSVRSQGLMLRLTYFDLILAQEKRRIAVENAALYKRTVNAVELRLKAGDLSASDAARIRVEALRAENDARQAVAELEKAQSALAYLIGAERESRLLYAADPWPDIAGTPQVQVSVEGRADIQAALARVRAAESARDLARSLRSRDISVGLQFEHYPPANTYGVGVSIPLFVHNQYEGETRRAEADLQMTRDALEQIRAQAQGEIFKARSDLEAAIERGQRFESSLLAEAERSARAAEFSFGHGAMGVMDLLDARRTLKATQIDAATARADYAKALAAWRAATQENVQ